MQDKGLSRRLFLGGMGVAGSLLPASIARALSLPARVRTGTVEDVEHVVILTQENRSFDHYFGTLNGVRGFGERHPLPVARQGEKFVSVWQQPNADTSSGLSHIAPFHLDTVQTFDYMRVEGTPHGFADGQEAWDNGRMQNWPAWKHNHSMGYYKRSDIPFQFALADAFTLCDAYFCAMHCSTNPNRLFIWTGTNDPSGSGGGPVINNAYDDLSADPHGHGGYIWTTYPERLQAAGISWQVYQNMDDNFTDNPLEGFRLYREALKAPSGKLRELAQRAVTTRDLDLLREDVMADALPQVSWIVATAKGSEHPGTSSPAQGADYTARVLDALTANPDVWAKTVLIVNFDENDGFFDHVVPPSVPARNPEDPSELIGGANVPVEGEYHESGGPHQHRAYGLGPRVPMYVVSPWSRGGYVNSQVFDHTSIIRFLETRFGVKEPNISAWRRSVCGDLTSCFNFETPNDDPFPSLPSVEEVARRASLLERRTPETPSRLVAPEQAAGVRPSRVLPYRLRVDAEESAGKLRLSFANLSLDGAGVCFSVYDLHALERIPRRYTLAAGTEMQDMWDLSDGRYDLWLTGPDGFHRRFSRRAEGTGGAEVKIGLSEEGVLHLHSQAEQSVPVTLRDNAYGQPETRFLLSPGDDRRLPLDLSGSAGWYDVSIILPAHMFTYAGRVMRPDTQTSDPALYGPALLVFS